MVWNEDLYQWTIMLTALLKRLPAEEAGGRAAACKGLAGIDAAKTKVARVPSDPRITTGGAA
jgi:hypothetical protein